MDLSGLFTGAVEQAAGVTALVDSRKRLPVSGILLAPDLVLSVDHGMEKEEDIAVQLTNGRAIAKVVGRDGGLDLAVLRLDRALPFNDLFTSEQAKVGLPVFAVGRPESEGVQASFGTVTAVGQALRTVRGSLLPQFYATSTTAYPGFSGGPLVNLAGKVLGMNTSGLIGGTSLVIPIGIAREVAEMLVKHGKIRRGYLGVRTQRVRLPEGLQSSLGEQRHGLLVVGLEDNGPAVNAGMMVGDILVAIHERPVDDQDSLMLVLSSEAVGMAVPVTIVRGGQIQRLQVTLGERA